jgi:hypothetical protein
VTASLNKYTTTIFRKLKSFTCNTASFSEISTVAMLILLMIKVIQVGLGFSSRPQNQLVGPRLFLVLLKPPNMKVCVHLSGGVFRINFAIRLRYLDEILQLNVYMYPVGTERST